MCIMHMYYSKCTMYFLLDASSKERKWSLLRKQEVNNMSKYLMQKEERLTTKQKSENTETVTHTPI